MNVNVPNLVNASVPDAEGRNVRVISDSGPNYRDPNFLSRGFPKSNSKIYVTAETDDFDELTVTEWRQEGFDVEYLAVGNSAPDYISKIRMLSKVDLGPCRIFGIIAFGDAAALCLEHFHILNNNPDMKLGLLIAYYPTRIPDPQGKFPGSISVLVHLAAGEEIGVTKQSQMLGIQGKRRVTRKKVDSGVGTGHTLNLAYPSYSYNAEPGFAEHDMEEYNRVCAELAWSRSLATARRAFGNEPNLEAVVEENVQGKFFGRGPKQAMSTYTTHKPPHVTNIPTLTGGIGAAELEKFYSEFFVKPPSMKLTLLSRTVGADRAVDELYVRFKHTEEVPWMLPGVPATNKVVEVLMVSIVTLRGGKLYNEHVYWDQASVLLQVGLLDPKLVPDAGKKLGVNSLPVVGHQAARRVLRGWDAVEEGEADNKLISDWKEE